MPVVVNVVTEICFLPRSRFQASTEHSGAYRLHSRIRSSDTVLGFLNPAQTATAS